ncbi:hypothetical protein [Arthrobacter sp. 135MFCol5.1]|uniref:hypothetical protein n=1 Tax=Arthrobacter sp. 135MFCol5.1 TaxID=1158050 RepID=UPI0012DBF9DF|nr:hypothetical protein [Arthrobacter sp. 135MFCol5.1]
MFATEDAIWKMQDAWLVKEQLRALLSTGSLVDAPPRKIGCWFWSNCNAAGHAPALADRLSVMEGDRNPHCQRRDNSGSGGKQQRHQTHQKDRAGIHQRLKPKTRILLHSAARTAA